MRILEVCDCGMCVCAHNFANQALNMSIFQGRFWSARNFLNQPEKTDFWLNLFSHGFCLSLQCWWLMCVNNIFSKTGQYIKGPYPTLLLYLIHLIWLDSLVIFVWFYLPKTYWSITISRHSLSLRIVAVFVAVSMRLIHVIYLHSSWLFCMVSDSKMLSELKHSFHVLYRR